MSTFDTALADVESARTALARSTPGTRRDDHARLITLTTVLAARSVYPADNAGPWRYRRADGSTGGPYTSPDEAQRGASVYYFHRNGGSS